MSEQERRVNKPHDFDTKKRAVDLLIKGKKKSHVCENMGISRPTLDRWLARDPEFQEYFSQQAKAQALVNQMHCIQLVSKAVDSVNAALSEDEDGTLGMKVLEKTNTLTAAGKLLGQEAEKAEGESGVTVVLNMDGGKKTIDVEKVE